MGQPGSGGAHSFRPVQLDIHQYHQMCFSEAFLAKFIPRRVRDRLRDQFCRLEQGSMSVAEYETRFHELSHHAEMILPTEEK
ncbi:hypothetical protein KY290_005125 [Solanum tuberosum]|uniref:Retrotransposon gag domain-containing protein n=1 Tax=Solanum tuberosum TaxID=4113 RepID=A0ABQ7WDC0_SOLTU|nr:hypothetical protein KY290_005125 [Solanum tuberosum]